MRGILLAGDADIIAARGSPRADVGGKPIAYYALCALLLAGVRDIIVVAPPPRIADWQGLLGGGERWGIRLAYGMLSPADDAAAALRFAAEFLGAHAAIIVHGRHILHAPRIAARLTRVIAANRGATLFVSRAASQHACETVELNSAGEIKALQIQSNFSPRARNTYRMTGLGCYDHTAVARAPRVGTREPAAEYPLANGAAELHQDYFARGKLSVEILDDDDGLELHHPHTPTQGDAYIQRVERGGGYKLGCPEEAAWRMGWITDAELSTLAAECEAAYAAYLRSLLAASPAAHTADFADLQHRPRGVN